jgi:PKD repeat protein
MQVRTSLFLTILMVVATLGPFAVATAAADAENNQVVGQIIGDIADFDPAIHGKTYMMVDGEPLYSATRLHKMAWADAGYPDLLLPFANGKSGKSTSKACVPLTQGTVMTIPTSGGQISATVEKTTATAAFLVEAGQAVSSSVLNNFASTWSTTIYPTNTQYFGSEPDVDNNCQVIVVIYNIDGPANIGGYFSPSLASQREAVYVDVSDLSWADTILAHEFQHLLHNSRDPFEYLWIDEGNADMAAFLCFGATSTIIGHANEWAQNSYTSVRWWNQSTGDYGAGFLFMLYLASKLGGGAAIQSLVADTATGGAGIVNLANNPIPGSPGNIGNTMPDVFANFTVATLLDDSQNPFGLDNVDMFQNCGSSQFCKLQITDSNSNWGSVWSSQGDPLEGWGVRAYKFTGGTGSPLNVMVQASELGFAGRLVYRNIATGTWTSEPMIFNAGMATGLVTGFGNISDEAYVLTWYESLIDDCDYAMSNCGWFGGGGTTYPTATIDIYATLISQPATIRQDGMAMHDRDNNTMDDTMEWILEINSTAFWESLDIQIEAFHNNTLYDEITIPIGVGQGTPTTRSVWFTPPWDGDWQLYAVLHDQIGNPVTNAAVLTLPTTTANMAPVSTGSLSSNTSQTWLPIQFIGAGYDIWGLSSDNESYTHNASPTGYIWDFGDGVQSWLRTPSRAYTQVGDFNATLKVTDIGGMNSIEQRWPINITDSIPPSVKISVGGQEVQGGMTLLTTQRVIFEAYMTDDNVPDQFLDFQWNWGDGTTEGGIGYLEADHAWENGSANGTMYTLTLTVSDGTFITNQTLSIIILNRVPRQIFDLPIEVDTLTPLPLPTVFTDDDGTIDSWGWYFDEAVNLDGGTVTKLSTFDMLTSTDENPTPAWLTPGLKNVTIFATDNAGNSTMAILQVTVNNQRPVALFDRPDDGDTETTYMFQSHSWDPDGENGNLTTIWTISEDNTTVTNQTSIVYTFSTPGTHIVELVVIDDRGLASLPKAYIIVISNPLPIPVMTIYEARDPTTGESIDVPSEDDSQFNWRHTFTDSGDLFVAPGAWLRFNSSGSRDGDSQFEGMDIPLDESHPNWNGIVEYTWDFGDGSPLTNQPNVWHSYITPGIYTITLSIRDGFGTGDVNQSTRQVYVASVPEIVTSTPFDEAVYSGGEYLLTGSAIDHDGTLGFSAWWDDNVFFDSDGNGIKDDDHDVVESVVGQLSLTYSWDLDDRLDADDDGDNTNDWIGEGDNRYIMANWSEPGELFIALKVCNGVGVCTEKGYPIRVRDPSEQDDTLADFSLDSLLPKAESSGILLGALLVILLILGWLVMRQPTEIEAEAGSEDDNYDVSSVVTEGGVLGMDHHAPPPKPKHLTTTDRRSGESGYVRPVTSRRRR